MGTRQRRRAPMVCGSCFRDLTSATNIPNSSQQQQQQEDDYDDITLSLLHAELRGT
jgi:hypothetical protein